MAETPDQPEPARDRGGYRSVFLPIGITFFVLGLIGLASQSMRPSGFAFLPIGITFLILGLITRDDEADEDDGAEPAGPDVTPR
jgi:hypothetical protein